MRGWWCRIPDVSRKEPDQRAGLDSRPFERGTARGKSILCRGQPGTARSGGEDDFLECLLKRGQGVYPVQLVSPLAGPNIKSIQRSTFFGSDPGVNSVEVVLVDGVEEVVEKSNAVDGLDLYYGEAGVALIVDVGPDGKGDGIIVFFPEKIVLGLKIMPGKIVFLLVYLIESHDHAHLPIVILYCLHIVGADPENIEG